MRLTTVLSVIHYCCDPQTYALYSDECMGGLALHIEYKLCKCSLMVKTNRGAEGKRGTINQHLSELPDLVWSDVSSASQRHWMQTS